MRAGWAWGPGPFLSAFLLQTQDPGKTSRERPALVGAADPGPTEQRPASSLLVSQGRVIRFGHSPWS